MSSELELLKLPPEDYSIRSKSELLVFDCAARGVGLAELLRERGHDIVRDVLAKHGAILFRGTGIASAEDFDAAWASAEKFQRWSGYPFMKMEGRQQITDRSFKSNYSQKLAETNGIYSFHQENHWLPRGYTPDFVAFSCVQIARRGGETGVVNVADAYDDLSQALKERLDRGVTKTVYKLEHHDWKFSYPDLTRSELEAELARRGADLVDYKPTGAIRIRFQRRYIERHPISGRAAVHYERRFFRDLARYAFYREKFRGAVASARRESWPRRLMGGARAELTRLGSRLNGNKMSYLALRGRDAEELARSWADHTVAVPYREGDLLLLDNVLTEHSALPWEGERRLVATMGMYACDDAADGGVEG